MDKVVGPDEPTCIYNPEYRPGENDGWRIVLEREVSEYLEKGWVRTPKESNEIRERVRATVEAEQNAEDAGVAPKKRGRPRKVRSGDDNANG